MNPKTLGMAAILAALCLMPAASAETGPDVTVTVDTRPTLSCQTVPISETVGPITVSQDDCVAVVDYDGNSLVPACAPQSIPGPASEPRVEIAGDCHVSVYA